MPIFCVEMGQAAPISFKWLTVLPCSLELYETLLSCNIFYGHITQVHSRSTLITVHWGEQIFHSELLSERLVNKCVVMGVVFFCTTVAIFFTCPHHVSQGCAVFGLPYFGGCQLLSALASAANGQEWWEFAIHLLRGHGFATPRSPTHLLSWIPRFIYLFV